MLAAQLMLLFIPAAQAVDRFSIASCRQLFDEIILDKSIDNVSNPRHLPTVLDHGRVTEYSVLLTHGLLESPVRMKTLAAHFHSLGFNVISILLPGHWEKDLYALDKVKYQAWIDKHNEGLVVAQAFGKKVILSGASLVGELSYISALDHPEFIKGLMLFAPALKLKTSTLEKVIAGSILNLNGNKIEHKLPPDGIDIAEVSPKAGFQIEELILNRLRQYRATFFALPQTQRESVYQRISIPVFIATTESDGTVSHPEIVHFHNSLVAPKSLFVVPKALGVEHNSLWKAPDDIPPNATYTFNPMFSQMVDELDKFINYHFPKR